MRILMQFPEGLKQKALELAKEYESDGHEVFLSASPCYGACDLALDEARWIDAEKIVHFGHNAFITDNLPIEVEYVPYSVDVKISKLEVLLPHIEGFSNIALGTTVQHVHQFGEMKAFLQSHGKKVFAEEGERAMERGQVLGCDASAIGKVSSKVEAIVFIGDGAFHALAIDMEKPVFVLNPYSGQVRELSKEIEKLRKKRKGAIAKALTCRRFGILLSTKPGQFNPVKARWAKEELGSRGYEASILVANEFDPMSLGNFMGFDCYVNTACPRIADDQERFGKPVLNTGMLRELLSIVDANQKA